jgi:hypothetical protein
MNQNELHMEKWPYLIGELGEGWRTIVQLGSGRQLSGGGKEEKGAAGRCPNTRSPSASLRGSLALSLRFAQNVMLFLCQTHRKTTSGQIHNSK